MIEKWTFDNDELFDLVVAGKKHAVHVFVIRVVRIHVDRFQVFAVDEGAFSNIRHGGIGLESVFINARTHEAFLFGGWENAGYCRGGSADDLAAVRSAARRLLGMHFSS